MSVIPLIALKVSVMCNPPSSGLFSAGKKQVFKMQMRHDYVSNAGYCLG